MDSGKREPLPLEKSKSMAITTKAMFLMTNQVVKELCSMLMAQSLKGTGLKVITTDKGG